MSNKISNLKDLFEKISQQLQSSSSSSLSVSLDSPTISDIMQQYDGSDWHDHVEFSSTKYNKKVVLKNDVAELMIISWETGQQTLVHDHPENGCILKVVQGDLIENRYSKDAEIWLNTTVLGENDVSFSKGKEIVHQITSICRSVSIHIYSPPNYVCAYYI
jgi:cysteine dioxygenase